MNNNSFTDPRDGNSYRTVKIGSQCWLAENLRYLPVVCPATTMPDDFPLFYVYDYQGYNIEEAKTSLYYQHYGVLYNWYAALQACPPGWHLPGDDEWFALTDFLIHHYHHLKASNVGFSLRSGRQIDSPYSNDLSTSAHPRWDAPLRPEKGLAAIRRMISDLVNGPKYGFGKDEFGFSALPGGRCSYGGFYKIGLLGYWWSASEASSLRAWCRQLTIAGTVNRWDMNKNYGYSLRCIKD